MPRELLLLRHGKSDWNTVADDFHRPLKGRGKRAARLVGVWLAQEGMIPDLIVTSPAERALLTARNVCKAMDKPGVAIDQDTRIYAAGLDDLLAVLADCPATADRVMLVGHNPGLEELLVWLAGEAVPQTDDGKLLPTAALAWLKMPDDWHKLPQKCAGLKSIIRSATLAEESP